MKRKKAKSSGTWICSNPTPWFSTDELLEYFGISNEELIQKLQEFTEGIHYKREQASDPNSKMLWRVDLVDELLCISVPPLEKEALFNAINNHITCTE